MSEPLPPPPSPPENLTTLPDQAAPVPAPSLSDAERSQIGRLLGFPLDLPPEFVTWMEGRMQLLMSAGNIQGLQQRIAVVGDLKMIAKDLTAQVSLYQYDDAQGSWLYCNGASFTAAVYPNLNTFLGGLVLPDARGRAVWMAGTNAATNLLDNDGIAIASRQPKHTHSDTFSVSGTFGSSGHTHSVTVSGTTGGPSATSTTNGPGADGVSTSGHTHSFSDTPTSGAPSGTSSPGISGSVGSGMAGSDAVAHCVVGSLLIKAD